VGFHASLAVYIPVVFDDGFDDGSVLHRAISPLDACIKFVGVSAWVVLDLVGSRR
jgi:hypothetical protein